MGLIWDSPERVRARSSEAVSDAILQKNLDKAADHERAGRRALEDELPWQQMRERARFFREDVIENLPELTDQLETSLKKAGCSVFRATSAVDAVRYVADTCEQNGADFVVKGKSMLSEEIGINKALEAIGVTPIETDLGEYIVQQRDEHPSHILAPAVHLNAAQVAELFSELGSGDIPADDTEGLVRFARDRLRDKFLTAEVGISGANFAIAETGTLAIVESEGNIRMCTTQVDVHIAIVGMERLVRDWEAASHLIQMLPMAAHGTRMPANVSLITGPAKKGETGPRQVHVVLVDNGRLRIRKGSYKEVLHCIRCAACVAACPAYRQVGGHTYGSTYSGPIGAVLTPLLNDFKGGSGEIAELSSLCGACREVCPVDIPLDDFLVRIRNDSRRLDPKNSERALFRAWSKLWSSPTRYRALAMMAGKVLAPILKRLRKQTDVSVDGENENEWISKAPFPVSIWTKDRDIRAPANESFHERWRRKRK